MRFLSEPVGLPQLYYKHNPLELIVPKFVFDSRALAAPWNGLRHLAYISAFEYNINWTKLYQESLEPEYNYQGAKGNVKAPQEEKVLFKTTFTNTTAREQEYSFKTERCTRSSSTVIIEKGVCRGMEVALKLKTPCEVVEANAGFHQEVQLNHIGNCVRVPPSSETVAELVILEEQCKRDFRIENRMSGKRHVRFHLEAKISSLLHS
ncbi:unnamed protein product [Nippostrongylus brasiliensis]|uniref:VWFD domain-containing protein n=1 Tax=Nippostrongylus brasiliensis TaxID=27835 RepID=A0A0N4XYW7_NIPBR|nr:unnamed protein product [Nippostrongylus brasiliensis]